MFVVCGESLLHFLAILKSSQGQLFQGLILITLIQFYEGGLLS